jgi:toxin ParE1/3/4
VSRRVVIGRRARGPSGDRRLDRRARQRCSGRALSEPIEVYCERFDAFSERGTRRDDLKPGVRTIGFERRVTVVFAVFETEVVILRLLYGGRDVEAAFEEDSGDV